MSNEQKVKNQCADNANHPDQKSKGGAASHEHQTVQKNDDGKADSACHRYDGENSIGKGKQDDK